MCTASERTNSTGQCANVNVAAKHHADCLKAAHQGMIGTKIKIAVRLDTPQAMSGFARRAVPYLQVAAAEMSAVDSGTQASGATVQDQHAMMMSS